MSPVGIKTVGIRPQRFRANVGIKDLFFFENKGEMDSVYKNMFELKCRK